jgi:hypothetical protein
MASDPNQGQPNNPNSEYITPQNPYNAPPQNPPAAPPQNPYGPPPQNPYAAPAYSNLDYSGGPAYNPPQSAPLPLGEAIRGLLSQYLRVTTRPGAMTFAEEMGKASWNIVWVQLIASAIISSALGYLSLHIQSSNFNPPTANPATIQMLQTTRSFTTGVVLSNIVIEPLFFFIGMGIFYGLAKAFGGQGRFLNQSYTYLLFNVPLGIITSLLSLIPFAGGFIAIAVAIYVVVLTIFSIMAVHRLSGGKASAVVLIPMAVLFLLACVLFFVFLALIASAIQHP